MKKIRIIIEREYLTRVKKPQFILLTLGAPFLLALFFVIVGFIFSYSGDEKQTILVSDPSGILENEFQIGTQTTGIFKEGKPEELFEMRDEEGYDGVLIIPRVDSPTISQVEVSYFSEDRLDIDTDSRISSYLKEKIRSWKMEQLGLEQSYLDQLNTSVQIQSFTNVEDAKDPSKASGSSIAPYVAGAIGMVIAFLIYFMVFINGMMIMRSVMEEKVNRIVEIMISTVRPFQLMMGKLIGVGAVGVTQILIWMILIPILLTLVSILGADIFSSPAPGTMQAGQEVDPGIIQNILTELGTYNWWIIGISCILFYVGGFLLYSSLFGAMGAMMGDDLAEGNSLSLIVTIPVILALYIGIVAAQSPNSPLAVWSSIFPLFSPIVMPCRLAYDPPMWQLGLSLILLFATTYGIVLLSGKIYRVGILMYGKKAGLKEIWKWMRQAS